MSSQPQSPFGSKLSSLPAGGDQVDVRKNVEPGTGLALATSLAVPVLGVLLGVFVMLGIADGRSPGRGGSHLGGEVIAQALGFAFFALMFAGPAAVASRRARVVLRASALRVGPRQFPEIHACAGEYARRLGLKKIPEIYVLDASTVNAFALKSKKHSMIVLTDETVAACLEGRSPGALAFVLGHELAHIALGHTSWWRAPLRRYWKLSRLDECSADNVACELVGTCAAAVDGVLLLAAGPRLLSYVDRPSALDQAVEVAADRAIPGVERHMTHPLILRRLARVAQRFGQEQRRRMAA